jgi:hypothetical protein
MALICDQCKDEFAIGDGLWIVAFVTGELVQGAAIPQFQS